MARRILFCAILGLFLAAGCATQEGAGPQVTVNLDNEATQEALVELAARRLAYYVARNNPEIIDPAVVFCAAFAAEEADLHVLIQEGIRHLDEEAAGDPLIAYDLETLLKLLDIRILDRDQLLSGRQVELVRLAARSFKTGLELARANPKT